MTDIDLLKTKIAQLKAMIVNNSITPVYLGTILDEIVRILEPVSDLMIIKSDLMSIRKQLVKLTPQQIESEEAFMQMAASGSLVDGQIYYVEETV